MVGARHIGRLANNLFQISVAIGYARKYGYEWCVDPRSGVGEPYSAIHQVFPNLPKADLSGTRYHEHANAWCNRHNMHYDLCHFDYHNIPDMGPNVVFSGFYQSWKYFEHCKEEVKEVFKLPHVEGYEDYVSIHVRRGDYVQHSGSFPPITMDYINEAIRRIEVLADGIPEYLPTKFMVFSDDIQWCKNNFDDFFGLYKFEFSEGHNELQDLSLMASCGHHIIANSSFSYWGAYLGHNPNRIVISPSCKRGNWFGMEAGIKKDVVDLLPPEWVQIEFR